MTTVLLGDINTRTDIICCLRNYDYNLNYELTYSSVTSNSN